MTIAGMERTQPETEATLHLDRPTTTHYNGDKSDVILNNKDDSTHTSPYLPIKHSSYAPRMACVYKQYQNILQLSNTNIDHSHRSFQ